MTRRFTAGLALALIALLIAADLLFGARPNPYQAPPIVALGSGAPSTGGFCGSLPE